MNKQQRKVVHVELINPPTGYKRHYYFGSVAAIYDTLPEDVLGISKGSLWSSPRIEDGVFENKKVIIRFGVIRAKKTNRGGKKE